MQISNLSVINDISVEDMGTFVNLVADACFVEDEESGVIEYAPYLADIALLYGFYAFMVDGIKFEENEDMLEICKTNDELRDFYHVNRTNHILCKVEDFAKDIIDFRKTQLANKRNDSLSELLNTLKSVIASIDGDKLMGMANKLNKQIENFSVDKIMEQLKYSENDILVAKDQQIQELQSKVNKLSAKNVLSDEKNVVSFKKSK